jgi:hypothetical protein
MKILIWLQLTMRNVRALFLVVILIFISCEKDSVVNHTEKTKFLLIEIKRFTEGQALHDSCASFTLDFAGYQFDKQNEILHVYCNLKAFGNTDTAFSIIYAFERSISGDLGQGRAGGILASDGPPDTLQIMTFPLAGQDTILINNFEQNGALTLSFNGDVSTVIPGTEKSYTYKNTTNIWDGGGAYKINDEIKIINNGFFEKDIILWH